jgi:3-oxoadipate enol-lactonase
LFDRTKFANQYRPAIVRRKKRLSFLDLPDARLWYVQSGEGPDIVWVPGGDNIAEDWDEQIAFFEGRFRNTAFDPRGAGRTISHRQPPWSIADLARDCAELIGAVCNPPVYVAGLSMGAFVALQMAVDFPQLVRGAISMGTAAKPVGFCRDWMIAEVEFRRAGGRLSPEFAIHHYGAFMYPSDVLGDEELWGKLRPFVARSYGEREGEFLAAQWQACIDFDVTRELPDCSVPIHVIGFSQDLQTPPALGRKAAALAKNGHFHLLEGLAHLSLAGHQPGTVNRQILECIEQIERDAER